MIKIEALGLQIEMHLLIIRLCPQAGLALHFWLDRSGGPPKNEAKSSRKFKAIPARLSPPLNFHPTLLVA